MARLGRHLNRDIISKSYINGHPSIHSDLAGTHVSMPLHSFLGTCVDWLGQQELRQHGTLLMQPLSARRMPTLLRFRMGTHPLLTVLGRRTVGYQGPALVPACNVHALSR